MSNDSDLIQLAEAYVNAYNATDFEALGALLDEDVHIIHHNRGVEVTGKDNAIALFQGYGAAFPDRAFSNRGRVAVVDGDVLVQHCWGGTAAAAVPGWAEEGQTISLDLTTFLTFRDGKLVDYHDFG